MELRLLYSHHSCEVQLRFDVHSTLFNLLIRFSRVVMNYGIDAYMIESFFVLMRINRILHLIFFLGAFRGVA